MPISKKQVVIQYVNERGTTVEKTVVPKRTWFGSTLEFPEKQWFLHTADFEIPLQHVVSWTPLIQPKQSKPTLHTGVGFDLV